MKTLFKKLFSTMRMKARRMQLFTSEHHADILIAGYNPPQVAESEFDFDRKPVGILYADIADYARLTEEDEEGTHRRLIESMEIMKAEIAANNGRVAHSAGDGILAEFEDAESALRCAVSVQLASRLWNADLDLPRQVRFRIGINFGDVIADQGDIYGKAVNLTARLEGLACSGGICVSKSVQAALAEQSEFEFIALGKRYVKNISEPVEVFWIEVEFSQTAKRGAPSPADAVSVTP